MNGLDFIADTNYIIYLLEGNAEAVKFSDFTFAISEITEMELLGRPNIAAKEKNILSQLIQSTTVLKFDSFIKSETIHIKQKYSIKLLDAIIAAISIKYNLPLLTADKGFNPNYSSVNLSRTELAANQFVNSIK